MHQELTFFFVVVFLPEQERGGMMKTCMFAFELENEINLNGLLNCLSTTQLKWCISGLWFSF